MIETPAVRDGRECPVVLVRVPPGQGLDQAVCAGRDGVTVLPDDNRA